MDSKVKTNYPDSQWDTGVPEDFGLDSARLKAAVDEIYGIEKRYGVLVIKDGVIIHEKYRRGANAVNKIFSLTKGFGATLIGIAQQQGMLSVHDKISDWLPVHHPEITADAEIRHVLNMTASEAPAGNRWRYNSNFILNSLTGILWLASGRTPVEFYREFLKEPLQLSFDWPSNPRGWIQIGSQGPLPVIETDHRDIARLGLLWLNQGSWGSEQILGADFVSEALTPAFPEANGAYGYLWWLNSNQGIWRTTGGHSGTESRWFPEADENVFMALGAHGKVMIVVPDHNLIMVSMGETPQEQSGAYLAKMMTAVYSFLPA